MTTPHNKIDATECEVIGCDRPRVSVGGGFSRYCSGHKGRKARTGDVQAHIPLRPIHSGRVDVWCDYRTAHNRVKNVRGKASAHACVDCGQQATEWSYNGNGKYEFTGPTHHGHGTLLVWSGDPADYDPRCKPCHMKRDGYVPPNKRV